MNFKIHSYGTPSTFQPSVISGQVPAFPLFDTAYYLLSPQGGEEIAGEYAESSPELIVNPNTPKYYTGVLSEIQGFFYILSNVALDTEDYNLYMDIYNSTDNDIEITLGFISTNTSETFVIPVSSAGKWYNLNVPISLSPINYFVINVLDGPLNSSIRVTNMIIYKN